MLLLVDLFFPITLHKFICKMLNSFSGLSGKREKEALSIFGLDRVILDAIAL